MSTINNMGLRSKIKKCNDVLLLREALIEATKRLDMISEVIIDVDKSNIQAETAFDRIRKYLDEYNFNMEIDNLTKKISEKSE